ncbi:MAG: hypothetical protein FK733_07715 [Asgard group archaeon]|nr:hypothetical protein [Asgard group archaeon]
MSYQIVPNNQPLSNIESLVESLRYKGGGIFRKKPIETLSYIKPLLWPVRHFVISFSKQDSSRPPDNYAVVRNFMLGNFSLPFLKNILHNDGGRKALSLIFSRENPTLLQSLVQVKTNIPVFSFYNPEDIYNQTFKFYCDHRASLEKQLDQIIKEMEPVYAEADKLKEKADILRLKIKSFTGDKKSLDFREMKSSQSDLEKQSKQLRRKADSSIASQERIVQVFNRKWNRGRRRFLGLRKIHEINSIEVLNTFYYSYWVARLDSPSSVRYLIIDGNAQQVRKLQNMLNFDANLRDALDTALHFKKFTSEKSCFFCGSPLDKKTNSCPKCSQEVLKCSVCKLPISHNDQTATCPKCESKAHLSHLYEWVKTQGKCPTCLQDIKLRNLILSSTELEDDS